MDSHPGIGLDTALLIAIVPLAAAAVRIWMYSGGDTSLFLVLLRTLDIPAVLVGTMVSLVPALVGVAVVVLVTDSKARVRALRTIARHPGATSIAVPIAALVLLYTTSWTLLLGLLALAAALLGLAFGWRAAKRRWPRIAEGRAGPDSMATVMAVVIGVLISPKNMWLPIEQIELADSPSVVAYVLQADSDWTTLLTDERAVAIVPSSLVLSRTICSSDSPGTFATWTQQSQLKDAADCD
ncbi:hypothetical protein FJ656_05920 [Schumannella luteola]|nr:hypothetical protein FJ656_05920 [Schumannella luteola]